MEGEETEEEISILGSFRRFRGGVDPYIYIYTYICVYIYVYVYIHRSCHFLLAGDEVVEDDDILIYKSVDFLAFLCMGLLL